MFHSIRVLVSKTTFDLQDTGCQSLEQKNRNCIYTLKSTHSFYLGINAYFHNYYLFIFLIMATYEISLYKFSFTVLV